MMTLKRLLSRWVFGTLFASTAIAITTATVPAADDVNAAADTAAHATATHSRYLEIKEERGRHVALRVATRSFVPAEGEGPTVALVSVTHIGHASFYKALDELLAEHDLVLFEGIGPPGTQPLRGETDEDRTQHTRESLRFIASIIQSYHEEHASYPADMDELRTYIDDLDPLIANWARHALADAWGNPLIYESDEDRATFTLRSSGSSGDDAPADDLRVASDDESIKPLARDKNNLQRELADALGLAYQLESLAYGESNWLGSDMHARELTEALREHDSDIALVEQIAGGASFPARIAQLLLRLVSWLDAMADGAVSDTIKIVMIELLGDEELVSASMVQLGEGFATVILAERNQVVIDDLKRLQGDQPNVDSIAVLYGAAHMADMARRLEDQLEYVESGEPIWFSAISVDMTKSSIEPAQIERMRRMVRQMLRQQMRQLAN